MNIALPQLQYSAKPAEPQAPQLQIAALSWGRESDWGNYVESHAKGTVFHSLQWRAAVREAFGHEDEYLIALRSNRIVGVIPMFHVRGPIIGRMLVSVPYAVGGGILANDQKIAIALFHAARRIAADSRCRVIEMRSEEAVIPDLPVIDNYLGFERLLPPEASQVEEWIPRKARAVVRNARDRFALACEFSPEALPTVWELYSRNMRRLGSINYPRRFFESIARQFGEKCWCCIVKREGRPVAGLMTLLFRDRVLPYFFGCHTVARRCGAANFVYFSVMERAVNEGYHVFDFGRSRRDNSGSFDFKRFHGFKPRPLAYQRFFVESKKQIDLTPTNPALGLVRRAWPYLPLAVTRPAGAMLSRYIPG